MKRTSIILLLGAALGIFGYRYFLKGGTLSNPKRKAKATYIGPEKFYTGLSIKNGDVLTGNLNNDGSLTYTMWGNGIVASNTEWVIPASDITNITSEVLMY